MDGYHDDLIMAMAMCLWVVEHSFKNLEKLEKQTKAMLNSWVSNTNTADAILENNRNGFVSKDNRYKQAAVAPKFNPVVAKNMQDPKGQYMWLFSGTK
jgi:hypothetical protein